MVSEGDSVTVQLTEDGNNEDKYVVEVTEVGGGSGEADHVGEVTEVLEEGVYSVREGDKVGFKEERVV